MSKTVAAAALAAIYPKSLQACAVCYGQSDSPMAAGMNWGILSLLVVIVSVLAAIVAFFFLLARKSAAASNTRPSPQALFGATSQQGQI